MRFGTKPIVNIAFRGLRLQRGAGVHRAVLVVGLSPAAGVAGTLLDLQCEVRLAQPEQLWLGVARARGAVELQTFQRHDELVFALTDRQVDNIEACAAGPDLLLDLDLHGRVVGTDGHESSESATSLQVTLRREEWLRQLASLQRASWFTVGVLEPPGDGGLADVIRHLRDAERLFNNLEYPSAATAVRKALEVIATLCPNMPAEKPIVDATSKTQDRPYEYRWAMLYHAAYRLAHLAPHADPVAASFTWSREDVQTLLALVHGVAAQLAAGRWPVFAAAGSTTP